MELLQLKYFLEVARHESITRAAASLHVSQPSLTQTIQRLEKELGVKLFERTKRRIFLTAKGHKFYDAVHSALNSLEEAKTEITHEGLQGHIVIGSYVPVAILLPCIHTFADLHSDVRFSFLSITNSSPIAPENLDALLMYGYSNALNFNERMKIGHARAVMIVPAGRAEEELKSLHDGSMPNGNYISLIQNDNYEEFFYNLYHEGRIPHIRYLTNSRSYKRELLEQGLGVGFSNTILTDEFRDTGRYEIIEGKNVEGLYDPDICLAWRGDIYLSPAAKALKEFTKTWFGVKSEGWSN